jgi:hypothetical protein
VCLPKDNAQSLNCAQPHPAASGHQAVQCVWPGGGDEQTQRVQTYSSVLMLTLKKFLRSTRCWPLNALTDTHFSPCRQHKQEAADDPAPALLEQPMCRAAVMHSACCAEHKRSVAAPPLLQSGLRLTFRPLSVPTLLSSWMAPCGAPPLPELRATLAALSPDSAAALLRLPTGSRDEGAIIASSQPLPAAPAAPSAASVSHLSISSCRKNRNGTLDQSGAGQNLSKCSATSLIHRVLLQ